MARDRLIIARGEHAVVLDPDRLTAIGRTLSTVTAGFCAAPKIGLFATSAGS